MNGMFHKSGSFVRINKNYLIATIDVKFFFFQVTVRMESGLLWKELTQLIITKYLLLFFFLSFFNFIFYIFTVLVVGTTHESGLNGLKLPSTNIMDNSEHFSVFILSSINLHYVRIK
jgi:hypothetical protein